MSISFSFYGEHFVNNDPFDELPQREVFILRLWHSREHPAVWQAQVQHIGSGKITHVRSFPELLECIFEHVEISPTAKTDKGGLK
jgi:hypothetical protein